MTWAYALSDPRDRWFGVDKEAHLFGAAFAECAFGIRWAIGLALLVEIVEALLWLRLGAERQARIEAGTERWPFFHDKASPKDLIADAAGILLALVVT